MFKKLFISLFASILILTLFSFNVQAYKKYDLHCSNFEVSHIEDDGSFKQVACLDSFEQAKQKMHEHNDYVIRHINSRSPMKIIAMNNGIAYSYAERNRNARTLKIILDLNYPGLTQTYINSHRDIYYHETTSYNQADGDGNIVGTISDFKGNISLHYVDLVPNKFFRNNLWAQLGGGDEVFNIQPKRSYYSVVQNDKYRDLVFNYYSGYANNTVPNMFSYAIGKAPEFMQENKQYYSIDGYNFYEDDNLQKLVGTYYNYYQFLPLRTKSKISAEAYDRFLEKNQVDQNSKLWHTGQYFLEMQELYGINAALVFGIGVNESAYGNSHFALYRNNLFGLNAIDSNPSNASYYDNPKDAIETMFSYYMQSYVDLEDNRFYGPALGNKGFGLNLKYASDPYWSIKAAKYAYELDKASNNYDGNLTDYGQYDVYLINKFDASFKKEANDNSETLHTSKYGKIYQKNFTVTPLSEENDKYLKIQFTNPIENNKVLYYKDIDVKTRYYWDQSVAYIAREDVTKINWAGYKNSNNNSFNILTDKVELNEKTLDFNFKLAQESNSENDLKYTINTFKNNILFKSEAININNGSENKYQFNLENLEVGQYSFELKVLDPKTNLYQNLSINYDLNKQMELNNKHYLVSNKANRLELEVKDQKTQNDTIMITDQSKPLITQIVEEFKIDDKAVLHLEGRAFFLNKNANEAHKIKHSLILRNIISGNHEVIPLETVNNPLNLNDGFNYQYIGYKGTVNLDEYRSGIYQFEIQVENDGLTSVVGIVDSDSKYQNIKNSALNRDYRIYTEFKDFYHLKIEVGNNDIDYSKVNKPDRRNAFLNLDTLSLNNNYLKISGASFIYDSNFSSDNDVSHKLLLVNKDTGKIEAMNLNSQIYQGIDFTKILNNGYEANYSQFIADLDLSNLSKGNYRLFIETANKQHLDILTLESDILKNGDAGLKTDKYQISINRDKSLNLTVN